MATCVLCGGRDGPHLTRLDGKRVPACAVCLAECEEPLQRHAGGVALADDERSVAWRTVAFARSNPGVTCSEIAQALGLPDGWQVRNAVSRGLSRAVSGGYLRRLTTRKQEHLYYPTTKDWTAAPGRPRGPVRRAA